MICPQCTNEVPLAEAQFLSMYTCPKCQAVYFIDITGQPEFGDMSLPIPNNAPLEDHVQTAEPNEILTPAEMPIAVSDFIPEQTSYETPVAVENFSDFNSTALEITDFANQDNALSALTYDLKISGLDTKETMLLFREAVDDSKFGWIAHEIFSTVKNGECEFKNLNPIQAFVLAKRIQFLDIEMEWKQNVQE